MPEKPARAPARECTVELAQEMASLLESDELMHVQSALAECRIAPATHHRWLAKGEKETESGEDTPHAVYYCLVTKARLWQARQLQGAAKGHADRGLDGPKGPVPNSPGVHFYTWQLETRFPKQFPRKQSVELSGPDGGPIPTKDLTAEDREAARQALNAMKEGDGDE